MYQNRQISRDQAPVKCGHRNVIGTEACAPSRVADQAENTCQWIYYGIQCRPPPDLGV